MIVNLLALLFLASCQSKSSHWKREFNRLSEFPDGLEQDDADLYDPTSSEEDNESVTQQRSIKNIPEYDNEMYFLLAARNKTLSHNNEGEKGFSF